MGKNDIAAQLDILIREYDQFPALRSSLKELKTQVEKQPGLGDAIEGLADALPVISKGVIAAKDAFDKGDNLTGASEIMNIVSAFGPLIGGLSSAGGPPGALIGAIFSMFGQILALFAPKQESDLEKTRSLLLSIEADGMKRNAESARMSIRSYASSVKEIGEAAGKALKERKLNNRGEAIKFRQAVDTETISIAEFKLFDGPTILKQWDVAVWLKDPDRQKLDKWTEILSVFCQAYAELLTAYLTIISFANGADMDAAFAETDPHYPGLKLDETERAPTQAALEHLQTYANLRLKQLKTCNREVLPILEELTSVARARGLFWYSADTYWKPWICAGDDIRKALPQVFNQDTSRTAVTMTRGKVQGARPELHVFGVESSYNNNESIRRGGDDKNTIFYGTLNSPYTPLTVAPWAPLEAAPGFHSPADIWATPGNTKTEFFFYTAKGKEIYGYRFDPPNGLAINSAPAKIPSYHKAVKSDLLWIRVVRPPEPSRDDPDDAQIGSVLKGVDYITYGGLKSSTEIYVDANGKEGYVPGPTGWGWYTGIGVDRNYLWIWAWGGPACATHASVMRCLAERSQGKMTTPRWIQTQVPDVLRHIYEGHGDVPKGKTRYNGANRFDDNPPPPIGLVELSPGGDGTLFAGVYTRTAEKKWALAPGDYWDVRDRLALYSGVYQVHLKEGNMDSVWSVIKDQTGHPIQKLPIYCWPLFESLKEICAKETGLV